MVKDLHEAIDIYEKRKEAFENMKQDLQQALQNLTEHNCAIEAGFMIVLHDVAKALQHEINNYLTNVSRETISTVENSNLHIKALESVLAEIKIAKKVFIELDKMESQATEGKKDESKTQYH